MATGREESDGRVVPKDRRKLDVTAEEQRGGKATTASEQARQLELFRETADSPEGADDIVLDELDRELEQRGHRFVRYADDCNAYVNSERSGQRVSWTEASRCACRSGVSAASMRASESLPRASGDSRCATVYAG
jgi:hypothetical protein